MLLAIDPGANSGWALFASQGGALLGCGLDNPGACRWYVPSGIYRVVIERPVIYPGGRTRNPNSLIDVALSAGEWAGRYRHSVAVDYVKPHEWRGQTPDHIQIKRDKARLTEAELAIVAEVERTHAKSKHEHFLDAVGIGLWALKRS